MPDKPKPHSECLELVCAVCTNLHGEKAQRKVREGREEELIREHVFPGFLRGYDWYPQGLCRICISDLTILARGGQRTLLLPSDYSCSLPRQLRSTPPGPCTCRWCQLARLNGQAFRQWRCSLKEARPKVTYLCTSCGMGVVEGQGTHTCSSTDQERVQAMVHNLPPELKGKLALALLREVQEEQGGDVLGLPCGA